MAGWDRCLDCSIMKFDWLDPILTNPFLTHCMFTCPRTHTRTGPLDGAPATAAQHQRQAGAAEPDHRERAEGDGRDGASRCVPRLPTLHCRVCVCVYGLGCVVYRVFVHGIESGHRPIVEHLMNDRDMVWYTHRDPDRGGAGVEPGEDHQHPFQGPPDACCSLWWMSVWGGLEHTMTRCFLDSRTMPSQIWL